MAIYQCLAIDISDESAKVTFFYVSTPWFSKRFNGTIEIT